MRTEIWEAQRRRVADEHPEDSAPARWRADRLDRRLVEARHDELLEPTPSLVDHAQRGVGGASQLGSSLDDPLKDGLNRKLGRHRDPGVEKGSQATVLGLLHAGMVSPCAAPGAIGAIGASSRTPDRRACA